MILIIFGIILLGITIWEVLREETDMLVWWEYLWFDLSRSEHPVCYWVTIAAQVALALGLIAWGIFT